VLRRWSKLDDGNGADVAVRTFIWLAQTDVFFRVTNDGFNLFCCQVVEDTGRLLLLLVIAVE